MMEEKKGWAEGREQEKERGNVTENRKHSRLTTAASGAGLAAAGGNCMMGKTKRLI